MNTSEDNFNRILFEISVIFAVVTPATYMILDLIY